MGINVGKQKRVISAQEDNPNLEKEDSSLETIANEYMKQDSYRRSQNKYGVDLRADEIAEDVPVEVIRCYNNICCLYFCIPTFVG